MLMQCVLLVPPRGRGVIALFAGPSGTGKTLAAEILATHLRLGLARIDLAAVVSKYIGETEKNLEQVFQDAEGSGTILFFDEADALFGQGSEVKDADNRYANMEADCLLQRVEDCGGVDILTTNCCWSYDWVQRPGAALQR
jgi:SpoVK/Ycf46/Vps4 family AAA+-type ATPase